MKKPLDVMVKETGEQVWGVFRAVDQLLDVIGSEVEAVIGKKLMTGARYSNSIYFCAQGSWEGDDKKHWLGDVIHAVLPEVQWHCALLIKSDIWLSDAEAAELRDRLLALSSKGYKPEEP